MFHLHFWYNFSFLINNQSQRTLLLILSHDLIAAVLQHVQISDAILNISSVERTLNKLSHLAFTWSWLGLLLLAVSSPSGGWSCCWGSLCWCCAALASSS